MKIATLKTVGTRDGTLLVVSDDLTRGLAVPQYPCFQDALDQWPNSQEILREAGERVNAGSGDKISFDQLAAPLPRAYQWADGSAYLNHVELVRKARGATVPESFYTDPLMYQGGSDSFIGPRDPIIISDGGFGIDMEAEIAVITSDVPMGASVEEAGAAILFVLLVNDVSLRNLIPAELAKGFGFFTSKPSSAFSPVAVSTNSLGDLWDNFTLRAQMCVDLNDEPLGRAWINKEMTFNMAELVAHAAKTRCLTAGTIIGSGTVSNKSDDGGPGRPISQGGLGYSCIAEQRTVETIIEGAPITKFLSNGDRVTIDVLDDRGNTIFGAIDQSVIVRHQR